MLTNKKILITNDDGINGKGLLCLIKEIYKFTKDILIVVPDRENSAVSHKMTLREGITLTKCESIYQNLVTYTIDGTPSDCVKIATIYLNYQPDYVISGMNNGLNLGCDILYSGTIAACFEAGLKGIKALAFSSEREEYQASKNIESTIKYITDNDYLKNELILNINMPINPQGFKITIQGKNPFETHYEEKDGKLYVKGIPLGKNTPQSPLSDVLNYHQGYISITPLTIDRTKY